MATVTLPKTLTAKTEAKAADVMADFNAILAQVNGKLDAENLAESLRNALIPTGSVVATARSSAPTGYLLCEGQAISRTTYATLFAAIGTTYGAGDGTTTFNAPDLRGRVPVGPDASAGRNLSNNALGQAGGSWYLHQHAHSPGSLSTSIETAPHQHSLPMFASARKEGNLNSWTAWNAGATAEFSGAETANHTHVILGATAAEGSGNAQNMPPFQTLNWMIKI